MMVLGRTRDDGRWSPAGTPALELVILNSRARAIGKVRRRWAEL
jgi:hypothetical protein